MLPCVSLLALATASWFGPAQASFDVATPGNPYDYRLNDVRVVFTAADGHREERLAYFDAGHWRAWLTTQHPGAYRATLTRNGAPVEVPSSEVVVPETARLAEGFVRVEGLRFTTDAGGAYFPLGHNLGWHYPDQPTIPEQLQRMGAAKMNWARVWACSWDGKNPFFHRGSPPPPLGELLPATLQQWDGIVAAAETAGVRLQFVLFHHGLLSTRNDSNWGESTWSRANGGFLDRPQEFFTDETAKEYARRWLRQAVARWGHSPAVMAWELFNEVEWVDSIQKDHDWAAVVAWHAEMAAFLRGLDPYRHLVTTSSALEHPALYATMDYYQPHTYPRDVYVGIAGAAPLLGKPWFFGEFGRGTWEMNADERMVVRDGIWAGLLSGHAGAAQYWYWERVVKLGLEAEFTRAVRALELSQLASRREARPLAVEVSGAAPGPMMISPGRGWGATERYRFELPGDAVPGKLVQWSAFLNFHTGENAAQTREPVELAFTLPADGEVKVVFSSVSGSGGGLQLCADGTVAACGEWPADPNATVSPTGGRKHQPAPAPMVVPLKAGAHVLRLESTGPDWVQLDRVEISGLGSAVQARAIGNGEFALVRVQATEASKGTKVDLRIAGQADGTYRVQVLDLETGAEQVLGATMRGGILSGYEITGPDTALSLQP
ncbi:MAG: cellulase family glycosylhydrolase [Opitutaceae bacterium]|nr:cellulase family glycosylhydrolase [Opitutaceae bacterium]